MQGNRLVEFPLGETSPTVVDTKGRPTLECRCFDDFFLVAALLALTFEDLVVSLVKIIVITIIVILSILLFGRFFI